MRWAVEWSSLLGGRLAMDGARLNFLTNIHVRASHYRLSVSSAMRDRQPARAHDLSMKGTCNAGGSHTDRPPPAQPMRSGLCASESELLKQPLPEVVPKNREPGAHVYGHHSIIRDLYIGVHE